MAQGFAYNDTDNLAGKNIQNYFGSNNAVVPSTETLLVTHTSTKDEILKYAYGGGETDGRFKLYVNSVAIWVARNAWTERNVNSMIEKKLASGDIVELKVTNLKLTNHFFSGGFDIYEL
jgi:hypothetical protein